tara:strand:+ start:1660 stop:2385 length:726 start_codon:yes stop_codon:yes gene_type:complete
MSKNIDDFLKGMNQNFIRAKFTNIKPDKSNIDKVYLNNINIWYYLNSDSVIKKDGNKEVRSKLDTINNVILLNPENFIFCKTQNGFKLTEDDFINAELKKFEELDVNKLLLAENKQFQYYKNFLLNKLEKPQQLQDIKPDEIKKELYNNIFKDNSIYLFEKYFENKSMTFQSRTDFRFLFEQMKKDNLIHDTVTLGQYIKFIGKYEYYEKELKAIELDALKNIQRTKDYNEYKDNLKTTLK